MQTEATAKAPVMHRADDEDARGADGVSPKRAALERSCKLGASLRALYDHVANEPIPDDFAALLAKLDEPKPPREPRS